MKSWRTSSCLAMATVAACLLSVYAVAQDEPTQPDDAQAPPRLFVSDKLVLNVYAEPGQGGERVATIETGDAVEELERADAFVRVRLGDGREGWVGAGYLTSDPPAAVRLRELQRAQKPTAPTVDKKSAEELARLRKQNAALESELKTLRDSAAAPPSAPPGETQSFDDLEGAAVTAAGAPPQDPTPDGVRIVFVALLVAVAAALAGFAAGYHTLARRLRRKFGGLKIY